tara:strand:- start:235 stop:531 length:297 start_codon:yes stop_codon:yes gene_type:complete
MSDEDVKVVFMNSDVLKKMLLKQMRNDPICLIERRVPVDVEFKVDKKYGTLSAHGIFAYQRDVLSDETPEDLKDFDVLTRDEIEDMEDGTFIPLEELE